MLQILADRHHADLWWSLQLLANRLGATLYTPYGMEWCNEGFYGIYGDPSKRDPQRYLAKQYLEDTIFDHSANFKESRETYNGCGNYPLLKTLTLEQAKKTPIDIVICSLNENEAPFLRLKEFYPNAKFIRQVGNQLDTTSIYPNLLASAIAPCDAFQGHKVLYRQEFPLQLFEPEPPTHFNNIYSFQNNLEKFEDTWFVWTDLKHKLPSYKFESYGNECENGKIYPKRTYINKILESSFLFQAKGPWEGYGHTIHNAMCLGRPVITRLEDYKGKMADDLLLPYTTFLEMDDPELPEQIKFYSRPQELERMSLACQQVFSENVNFDKEFEEKLKPFFENLI